MAYREFTDGDGRAWRAWDTYPQKPQIVAPGFEDGWLSFEAEGEKYRLVPIPPGWDALPYDSLMALLRSARAAAPASAPPPPVEPALPLLAADAVPDALAGSGEPEPV
jgi:hypothetical protein